MPLTDFVRRAADKWLEPPPQTGNSPPRSTLDLDLARENAGGQLVQSGIESSTARSAGVYQIAPDVLSGVVVDILDGAPPPARLPPSARD